MLYALRLAKYRTFAQAPPFFAADWMIDVPFSRFWVVLASVALEFRRFFVVQFSEEHYLPQIMTESMEISPALPNQTRKLLNLRH